MVIRFLLRPVLVGAVCLVAILGAVGAGTDQLAAVDPSVRIVVPCGIWQDGDQYGSTRVVVYALGWEHVRSFVIAQWLLHDDASQTVSLLKSAPVKELNEGSWVTVDSVHFTRAGDAGVVEIAYRQRDDEKPKSIRLQLSHPGVYNIVGQSKR